MFWVQLCVMFGVVFVVCMVALGGDGGLGRVHPDRPEVAMPPDRLMVRPDVDSLRFSTGVRGYRMDEVDDVLDRLATELQVRDDYIAQLQARLTAVGDTDGDTDGDTASGPAAPGETAAPENTPADTSGAALGAWAGVAGGDPTAARGTAQGAATTDEVAGQPAADASPDAPGAPDPAGTPESVAPPAEAPPSESK